MGDFLDIGSMGFVVDLDKAKEMGLTHLIKKAKQRTTTSINKDGTEIEQSWLEVELYDAQAALVHIAKLNGDYVDKSESTIHMPGLEDAIAKIYGRDSG